MVLEPSHDADGAALGPQRGEDTARVLAGRDDLAAHQVLWSNGRSGFVKRLETTLISRNYAAVLGCLPVRRCRCCGARRCG